MILFFCNRVLLSCYSPFIISKSSPILRIVQNRSNQPQIVGLFSFLISCFDDSENKFLDIGKVGTGIKEKSEGVTFIQLTKLLKPLITKSKGKTSRSKTKN